MWMQTKRGNRSKCKREIVPVGWSFVVEWSASIIIYYRGNRSKCGGRLFQSASSFRSYSFGDSEIGMLWMSKWIWWCVYGYRYCFKYDSRRHKMVRLTPEQQKYTEVIGWFPYIVLWYSHIITLDFFACTWLSTWHCHIALQYEGRRLCECRSNVNLLLCTKNRVPKSSRIWHAVVITTP